MNYMEQVAKMLGVELEEEFEVVIPGEKEHTPIHYQFNCNQFGRWESKGELTGFQVHWDLLLMILCGQAYIKKLPWKPKEGEKYYYVCWIKYNTKWKIMAMSTNYTAQISIGPMRVAVGNCFKTEEEAEAQKYEVFKRLTGKDWEETYGKENGENAAD